MLLHDALCIAALTGGTLSGVGDQIQVVVERQTNRVVYDREGGTLVCRIYGRSLATPCDPEWIKIGR